MRRLAGLLASLLLATSCSHRATGGGAAKSDGAPPGTVTDGAAAGDAREPEAALAIAHAEEGRRARDISEGWLMSADVRVRRRAVRALSRIVEAPIDAAAEAALLRALADEDAEVAGWAGYGLGWACKGKEDAHVMALAARAATLLDGDAGDAGGKSGAGRGIDARTSLVRAVGRCGGALAEGVLTGFVAGATRGGVAEEAAYALGAVAGRHALGDEAMGALLDRAANDPSRDEAAAALFPIGRLEHVPEAWSTRVLGAARASLAASRRKGFALRALEKTGVLGVSDLASALTRRDVGAAERADAARALGRLGAPGREAAAGALARMLQDHALLEPSSLTGDAFNVLLATVESLGPEAPRSADAPLRTLAALPPVAPDKDGAPLALRVVALRCAAAGGLARAAFDADVLAKCDPSPDGAAGQRARLAALVQRPLVGERRKAFRALAESTHVVVREAALEAVAVHPELDETGRALLVQGLTSDGPGVVATAAQAIVQHPERVLTLAASERRAGFDPRSKLPTAHPAMDLPAEVKGALSRALAHPWREDAVETRTALLDAAVAVSSPDAQAAAVRACSDPNVTVREHAAKALRALGAPAPTGAGANACPAPEAAPSTGARPTETPISHDTRVTFTIAGAPLSIVFEPDLAPIAASRFVALARAGFYKGIVVHRVVPGYVVQFGDPEGDGYGGSGELLPCETSPAPFDALDVGVALAGRDTGSSQIFVTLARYPKLDGDYARVGRAESGAPGSPRDWAAVAEGDVIDAVKVEE